MRQSLYIVRHGQDEDNFHGILNGRRDRPLTQLGIDQAYEVADIIAKLRIPVDKILSSPLKRAIQTAEIIASTLGSLRVQTENELIERDFGEMTGKPIKSINLLCSPNVIETERVSYFLNPKGAETFPVLLERSRKLLRKIIDSDARQTILLVTHGDFGKMIVATACGMEWNEVLSKFYFGNTGLIELKGDYRYEMNIL